MNLTTEISKKFLPTIVISEKFDEHWTVKT